MDNKHSDSKHPLRCLVTFADSRLIRSLNRIRKQAEAIDVYDDIFVFNEDDLGEDIKAKLSTVLTPKFRGFGYWSWKPYFVLKALSKLQDGDVVQWVDAGCWINKNGRTRLLDYFQRVENSQVGLLGFQARNETADTNLDKFLLPERRWTKGDIFDYFGVRDISDIVNSNQIEATSFFVRKSTETIAVIEKWQSVFYSNMDLVNDSPSLGENFSDFVENRHDQSVFSILMKIYGGETNSAFETYYPVVDGIRLPSEYKYDWSKLDCFPIWAKRDKNLGLARVMMAKLNSIASKFNSLTFGNGH